MEVACAVPGPARAFPALPPLDPSLPVSPRMRSCPSHPGVGDLDLAAEGVWQGGRGWQKADNHDSSHQIGGCG